MIYVRIAKGEYGSRIQETETVTRRSARGSGDTYAGDYLLVKYISNCLSCLLKGDSGRELQVGGLKVLLYSRYCQLLTK